MEDAVEPSPAANLVSGLRPSRGAAPEAGSASCANFKSISIGAAAKPGLYRSRATPEPPGASQ
jgi:hypothetical protein